MSRNEAANMKRWTWLAALLVLAIVVQNAWICDDAFITARVARNVAAGEGAVFNPRWRVQVYTHPLWMLMMVPGLFMGLHPWWMLLGLGLGCTCLALWLMLRRFTLGSAWPLALLALACSQSAIDYSTSGLENPLLHVLVLGFAASALQPPGPDRLRRGSAWLSAAFCCRPDAPLLLLPGWLALLIRHPGSPKARVRELLLGSTPALAWLAFALAYHGSALPNTALAKLATGIPIGERALAGLHYLGRSANEDPIGSSLLLVGTLLGLRHRETRWIALGIPLTGLYLLWIGGDFMLGRFLSAPIWLAAAFVARSELPRRAVLASAVVLLTVALASSRSPFKTTAASGLAPGERAERHGIADERRYYARHSSLFAISEHGFDLPQHPWRTAGESLAAEDPRVQPFNTVGYYAWFAPSQTHVIDAFALCDPLLARLPPLRRIDWRPGHFARAIPHGYLQWLASPSETVRSFGIDAELTQLIEDLRLAHHDPLLSPGRFGAIWRLAAGHHTVERDRWWLRERKRVPLARLARSHRPQRFRDAGLWLEASGSDKVLSLEFSAGLKLVLRAFDAQGEVLRSWGDEASLSGSATVELPADAARLELWPIDLGGHRSATVCVSPCRPG